MQNTVYIKHCVKSEKFGRFEIGFEKIKKKFQTAFDKRKKYAILNSCRASVAIVSKNDGSEKSLKKKFKLRLTKLKSVLY